MLPGHPPPGRDRTEGEEDVTIDGVSAKSFARGFQHGRRAVGVLRASSSKVLSTTKPISGSTYPARNAYCPCGWSD